MGGDVDYQSNSHAARQGKAEKKVVEKVVLGTVVQAKPGFFSRLKSALVHGDFKSVVRYISTDVLFPSVRNLIVDTTTEGVKRAVYGESRRRTSSNGFGAIQSRFQYNVPVTNDRPNLPDQRGRFMSSAHKVGDLILSSKDEAETVLERMLDILEKYKVVSLADLYDLTGLPNSHIDNKWGWTYLNTASVRQVREGYLLELPPLEEI